LILTKEDIKNLVSKVMNGVDAKDACQHITLNQTREEFDRVMVEAIFDVWIHIGDSGYNRKGFREAFDAVENEFFPKEQKEEKDYSIDEHFPFDGYF